MAAGEKGSAALGFSNLPILRQVMLLAGLALSISSAVAVFMWFQKPSYGLLYASLAEKDIGRIMEVLQQSDIEYKIDTNTGSIMVPGDKVHEARLKLAMEQLPRGANMGFELLEKDDGFKISPLRETARFQRAMEGELARSIASFRHVRKARVHLAMPNKSPFATRKKPPRASVLLELYPGRQLNDGQISAIVHLVASSIPNLSPNAITVVDQNGQLLTGNKDSNELARAAHEFEFVKKIEQDYIRRIENILEPIVGEGGVRAQVVAEVDLTYTEQTQELFEPELRGLKSEHLTESTTTGGGAGGVPGALSNQPPPAGTVNTPNNPASAAATGNRSITSRKQFDVSKTYSYSKMPVAHVKRVNVAVVVNNRSSVDDKGKVVETPLGPDELARITTLVKRAVGFNDKRGDSVNVINAGFNRPAQVEPLPPEPVWQQPWLRDIIKILFGIIVAYVLFAVVLRPLMRNLAQRPEAQLQYLPELAKGTEDSSAQLPAGEGGQNVRIPQSEFDKKLEAAKSMAAEDPKRVAQVVKSWLAEEGS